MSCEKKLSNLISNQKTLLALKTKHIPSALLAESNTLKGCCLSRVKIVIMRGFHWRICFFYPKRWQIHFSEFEKKHNVAVVWTHRSSSESVITPNNVQSCQAPLPPLRPPQISFVWMCNYFCCTERKTIGILQFASLLEAACIWKRGLFQQPALSPNIENTLALCCVSSSCSDICGSPVLRFTKTVWQECEMGFLVIMRL